MTQQRSQVPHLSLVDAAHPSLVDAAHPSLVDAAPPSLVDAAPPSLVEAAVPHLSLAHPGWCAPSLSALQAEVRTELTSDVEAGECYLPVASLAGLLVGRTIKDSTAPPNSQ